MRLATQLLRGNMSAPIEPQPLHEGSSNPEAASPSAHQAAEAARTLERALAQVESMLGRLEEGLEPSALAGERQELMPHELAEMKRVLQEVVQRLEDALDHLGIEAQRLADETSRLSLVADRLEARLGALARAVGEAGEAPALPAQAVEPAPPPEPQFEPADHPVEVVIAAVPGFQGLMDAQRGLSSLPGVEGASVHRYQNGEASLAVALRASVTAREIVEGLRQATGHELVIEEARPEAARLRLRFVGS